MKKDINVTILVKCGYDQSACPFCVMRSDHEDEECIFGEYDERIYKNVECKNEDVIRRALNTWLDLR